MPRRTPTQDYPDDIFDHTRMSFGDHIEVLRSHLIRALVGLLFFLIIGFVLDSIGDAMGRPNFGVGRPMMRVITAPVEEQVKAFYLRRQEKAVDSLKVTRTGTDDADRIREELKRNNSDVSALGSEDQAKLRGMTEPLPLILPLDPLEKTYPMLKGQRADPNVSEIELTAQVYPVHYSAYASKGETYLGTRRYLTTLSATEAFMVYFKVSLLCGVVLASPWIFYQLWSFIAAGLYPHERKYVHLYLPFSVMLFISGVLVCQFLVLPGAVKALLGFNSYIDLDPDLRLNEWLGFAIMLPLVFGISFQTPLVMFFLNRLGMFTAQAYWSKWRYAVIVLAAFSAIITPTPDVFTMLYLFVPMFGLYMLGAGICHVFPPPVRDEEEEAAMQVAV